MSDKIQRDDDAEAKSAAKPETPPKKGKAASEDETQKKSGLDYVFKIAPADPKNAFDFEDVADK